MNLSRRTGIRTIESGGEGVKTVYRIRGRLRVSGAKARLNLTMVLCETGQILFSRNYDGDITDIFEFGDQITAKISADLRIQINAYDADRLEDLSDDELSISELRSRAARRFYDVTYPSWQRGFALMERAVELTPDDPMSLAMRAIGDMMLHGARKEKMDPERAKMHEEGLNLAIKLAPKVDFLFSSRANFNSLVKGDGLAALRDAEQCMALNPNYQIGYGALGLAKMLLDELPAAIERLEFTMGLSSDDPLEPQRTFPLAVSYYLTGQYQKARSVIEKLLHVYSEDRVLQKLLAMSLRGLGDVDGAAKQEELVAKMPFTPSISSIRMNLPPAYDTFAKELWSVARP
jgi:adenylate cyclase